MRRLLLHLFFAFFLISYSSITWAQSTVFLSQMKSIITSGEKGEMSKLKGVLFESTSSREEEYRVYKCLQPLHGFDINFSESKEFFSLSCMSANIDSAKLYIDALLNKQLREQAGITGYENSDEYKGVPGTNPSKWITTLLQKSGSKVSLKILEHQSKTISMISISVAKGSITSPPIEKAKTNIPLFLQQMKTIIEASKSGLSSHKVKLVYTTEDGDKNYTSDLLLEGYTTYIIERDDAILFHAASDDITLSGINILKLLDKTQREQAGILGYTTNYTAINPTSSLRAEGVTKFSKPGTLSLKVYKNLFDKGYRIEIEDFFME